MNLNLYLQDFDEQKKKITINKIFSQIAISKAKMKDFFNEKTIQTHHQTKFQFDEKTLKITNFTSKSFLNNNNQIMSDLTIQKNENFISFAHINSQYQNLTLNSSFEKQNEFMKQSSKMITSKFKTTTLTNKKTNETNRIYNAKMKTFVTSKSSSLNKTQIKKFNHFSTNLIAIDASNEKKFAFKNSLKSSKIINFIKQLSKTTTSKFEITILINEKTDETHYMHDVKMKIFVI